MDVLFTLPIVSTHSNTSPPGSIVCTNPSSTTTEPIYLLTVTSAPDNRLCTALLQALLLALDMIELAHPHGVVVTTSGITKFYSNGLDLEHALGTPGFFPSSLFAVFRRLLTYPMPTIALLNGHAFAGGFILAMYHDYRVMNMTRGFVCLNELDLGVPLKPAMSSVFRQKLRPEVYRSVVLEAKRFNGQEALQLAIVDALGGWQHVLDLVAERKLVEKAKTGVYGMMKAEMWRESLALIDGYDAEEQKSTRFLEAENTRQLNGERRLAERRTAGRVKL